MEYLVHILVFILIYALVAMALNMMLGWGGLLNLAQPVFLGIGAYSLAIAVSRWQLPPVYGIVLGIVISIVVSLFLSQILAKLESEYYALASIGLLMIFSGLARNLESVTNGPLGISGIPRFSLGLEGISSQIQFLIILMIIFCIAYVLIKRITENPFGRILAATRDDEKSLEHLGYETIKYKILSFTIASITAAVAGALLASYFSFINPAMFNLAEAISIFSIVIIGGLGSTAGACAGTFLLMLIPELLRFMGFPDENAAHIRLMIYGACLAILPILMPRGLFGRFQL